MCSCSGERDADSECTGAAVSAWPGFSLGPKSGAARLSELSHAAGCGDAQDTPVMARGGPGVVKHVWHAGEDARLAELVSEHGKKSWTLVAKHLGGGRNGKQCRERWHNHLDPDVKKGMWSVAEDEILRENHHKFGNRWARIAEVTDSLSPPAEAHARTHT